MSRGARPLPRVLLPQKISDLGRLPGEFMAPADIAKFLGLWRQNLYGRWGVFNRLDFPHPVYSGTRRGQPKLWDAAEVRRWAMQNYPSAPGLRADAEQEELDEPF